MARLLITGVTGLIGASVLKAILHRQLDFQITALVRPGTSFERYAGFETEVEIVQLDLADTEGLKGFLKGREFELVAHIGALRGGRKFPREQYLRTNLICTQLLVEYCQQREAILLYCSSVGVFGAIPRELPANNESERNPDNYYHYTKIESEKLINHAVLNGLKAAILRPSITYGRGDQGFPYQLVRLVKAHEFPMINKRVWIHLCHIDTITNAFIWLLTNEFKPGLALNVADREPVQLNDLVNFISRQVHGKSYHPLLYFDRKFFRLGEHIAKLLKSELWVSRFELISRSWFYYVADTYQLMQIPETYTIPGIQITIADYLEH